MRFKWDPVKAKLNSRKHGVCFSDACLVFQDPLVLSLPDLVHSIEEERWVSLGAAGPARLLVVVHTYRMREGEEVVRIISARSATTTERRHYRERTP